MNWNPTYSPVWKWLRDHAGAALLPVLLGPGFVEAVAGPYAGTVKLVLGALTAAGVLGTRYGKTPEPVK